MPSILVFGADGQLGHELSARARVANITLTGVRRADADIADRAAVESAIARSGAGIGIVFFLQSLPALLGEHGGTVPFWSIGAVVAIVSTLLFTVVAAVMRRLVRVANVTFAVVFLVVLVSWPFAVLHPSTDSPWLYYLITIATALAAIVIR